MVGFSSNPLSAVAGRATTLTVTTPPAGIVAAVGTFGTQPVVHLLDAYGRLRTQDNSTTVTATRAQGTGNLSGTLTKTVAGGIATFTDLAYDTAESFTLSFASTGAKTATVNAVAVFKPTSIANITAWFNAESLALTDGADVTAWPDSSGNARDLSGSPTYPVYKSGIVNGRPVVRFTTSSATLSRADAGFHFTPPNGFTYMAAVRWRTIAAFTGAFTNGSTDNLDYSLVLSGADAVGSLQGGSLYNGVARVPNANQTYVFAFDWRAVADADQYRTRFFTNNVQEGSSAGNSSPSGESALYLNLFYHSGNFGPADVDICELVFYQRDITDGERTQLYNYLAARWL